MAAGFRLGLDLGTSSLKAVIVDEAGGEVAAGAAAYPTVSAHPGQAEQDPAAWAEALVRAVADALLALGPERAGEVKAIGVTGQLPTLVCLSAQGKVVGPAITWCDTRAEDWVSERLDSERRRALYEATGMPIDGRYLAPMFRVHFSETAEVAHIVSAKDYLCYLLTGRLITDPSTASGYAVYDINQSSWSEDLCAFWGLDPRLLPEIGAPDSCAGGLREDWAARLGLAAGLPVAVGCADSVAGAYALCGYEEGMVSVVMGSSTIIIAPSDHLCPDPKSRYLLTPYAQAGWFAREMDLLATGTGFSWLSNLLGHPANMIEAMALRAPPGADSLLFAPYLGEGEQGALWDSRLRGVVRGLKLAHGPAHIARAYFEGVLFEIRRCLDVLEEFGPVRGVTISGQFTHSPGLLLLGANALGRKLTLRDVSSPSAVGAALLTPGSPYGIAARPRTLIAPTEHQARYDEFYSAYLQIFPHQAR